MGYVLSPYERGKRRHGGLFLSREGGKDSNPPRAGHMAYITGGDEGAAASRRGYKVQRAWVLLSRDKNLSVRASCHGISTRG
jgi:hypothetical protein